MTTIQVNTSTAYNVMIGRGFLSSLGEMTREVCSGGSAVIVSDSTVFRLFGTAASESLCRAGFSCLHFVFPGGEEKKSPETYLALLNFLAQNGVTRSDILIALGGGVVGDLTGFAAATYLRGIAYVQVPTTLLAAVDSSVGGKTAIDLPAGKNLVGTFWQPALVVCDTDTLSTLPTEVFRDGCAEVIKYGVLFDPQLLSTLKKDLTDFHRESVIARCVSLKRDVVGRDEYDAGERKLLNLGHTVAHAIERCSGYTVSHGYAVAMGMAVIARASAAAKICPNQTSEEITSLLEAFDLPVFTRFTPAQLAEAALSDKKRRGNTLDLILPRRIGQCFVSPTPVDALSDFFAAGM